MMLSDNRRWQTGLTAVPGEERSSGWNRGQPRRRQRCTLARVAALIATLFHRQVSIPTVWQVMRRLGYTAQLPIHRAAERDEQAIAHWRRYQRPALKDRASAERLDLLLRPMRPDPAQCQGEHLGAARAHADRVGDRRRRSSRRRPGPADTAS
jgi:hypothetical protein